mgnify:CR=1 FL=1
MVYPACAGIHLSYDASLGYCLGLPRMRGDPPHKGGIHKRSQQSTPHARGSTRMLSRRKISHSVYPACAGIHPLVLSTRMKMESLPRMRGDPPYTSQVKPLPIASTPHARGSTLNKR